MNTQKQHQFVKVQKSSILFLQLGLVLALIIVYLSLEFTSVKKITMIDKFTTDEPTIIITAPSDIIIVRKPTPKVQPILEEYVPLIDPIIKPNVTPFIEQGLIPIEKNSPIIDINSLPGNIDGIEENNEPIDFIIIEEAPVFPGCEGLDSLETKKCFSKQVSKFVNKRFDTSLAEGINSSGKQRIWVEFKINKYGIVDDIIARSHYKELEKEAIRVVQKLPKMTPGKQRKRPVTVKYMLPIVFYIE